MSRTEARRAARVAFVGDVHLEPHDPLLPEFLAFLDRLGDTCSTIVLLGDLFDLWIGRREIEQPHQAAVAERLAALRRHGLRVRYVEGNRDYRIADAYAGMAFDDCTESSLVEELGGRRIHASHGDLVNVDDRRYRAWRKLSRTPLVWGTFGALPREAQLRVAMGLERVLGKSNREFKREFPQEHVQSYAAARVSEGFDLVVLGHFHVERDLPIETPAGQRGRALVLPLWRESRRHLQITEAGEASFVDS